MHRTGLRHQMRKLREALDKKDKAAAAGLLKPTFALIDHSIHNGILHRNPAARYKSRLTLRFNALACGRAGAVKTFRRISLRPFITLLLMRRAPAPSARPAL